MSGFNPSTTLATGTEPLLIAVVGLLTLVIVGLAAIALAIRRKGRATRTPEAAPITPSPTPVTPPSIPPRRRPVMVRGGGGGGGLAVATSTAMVCPTCRTEYHGMTYCTRDARRLVPPEEMLTTSLSGRAGIGRSAGLVCMACRRAYEPGLRSCPHDGTELVPFSVYNATRPRRRGHTEPAGVVARICPICAAKYDLNARFCGHDAGELVVIN